MFIFNSSIPLFYDSDVGRFLSVDPLASQAPSWSTYRAFFYNPISYTDPTGLLEDWYQNDETGDYTWFEGSKEKAGFTHIGDKGSVLGEFESYINDNLINVYGVEGGMYSEGFTFDIVDNNKGALLPLDGKGDGCFHRVVFFLVLHL